MARLRKASTFQHLSFSSLLLFFFLSTFFPSLSNARTPITVTKATYTTSSGSGSDLNTTTPTQITIAFAGEEGTSMAISWFTTAPTSNPQVKFGLQSSAYQFQSEAEMTSYIADAYNYHSVLENLTPGTTYYYVVGGLDSLGGEEVYSLEYSFVTAPAANDFSPFRVAVYGDLGLQNGEQTRQALLDQIEDLADWHYHVGDYAYADDGKEANFELTWNLFQNEMEPITARKAYMTCPGNHEASCHDYGNFECPPELRNFTAYRNRYRMPGPESGGAGNMWYSFNYSSVHFVSVDTETDFLFSPEGRGTLWNAGPFGDQLAWLENDLKQADEARAAQAPGAKPWIIVIGHRPLYSTIWNDFPWFAREHLRAAMEELFHTYHVDLYICGHIHSYERMYPIYKSKMVASNYDSPGGTTYLVVGNAGNVEGLTKYWDPFTPDWLAVRNYVDYGYGVLSVENTTTLHWTLYNSADQSVLDQFTLIRGSPW